MSDIYNIKGTVYDDEGNPAGNRKVFVLNRENARLERTLYSDQVTGEFSTNIDQNSQYMVICMPSDADTSNAKIYDRITPTFLRTEMNVNKIGVPGTLGFGVGVCPNLPSYMFGLEGYDDIQSPNYGNYQVAFDGSIMVWIPAFYYKYGTGTNGLEINQVDIKDLSDYATPEAAALEGFALHRAFIDGGAIKQGFFVDKYQCSLNPSMQVPSSLKGAIVGRTWDAQVVASFNLATNISSFVTLPKFRGNDYFCMSVYMRSALVILSIAHGSASNSVQYCAWYSSDKNNNSVRGKTGSSTTAISPQDSNLYAYITSTITIISDGYSNNAKTTHNGMLSGVFNMVGGTDELCIGIQRATSPNGNYYMLPETFSMKSATSTGSSAATDVLQSSVTAYENIGAFPYMYATNYLKSETQIFSEVTDRTNVNYKKTSLLIPLENSLQTTSTGALTFSTISGSSAGSGTFTQGSTASTANVAAFHGILSMSTISISAGLTSTFRCGLYL